LACYGRICDITAAHFIEREMEGGREGVKREREEKKEGERDEENR
jgi:hypothetical protein